MPENPWGDPAPVFDETAHNALDSATPILDAAPRMKRLRGGGDGSGDPIASELSTPVSLNTLDACNSLAASNPDISCADADARPSA